MNAPLPEAVRQALERVTLDDKYALDSGRAFMSGVAGGGGQPKGQRKPHPRVGRKPPRGVWGDRGAPRGCTARRRHCAS
jgi:indolepyruvate ferredoxin oxidoreductase